MEKIKLGSLCLTKHDKIVTYHKKQCVIKKDSFVTVCDDDNVDEGFVFVELEGYDEVFGFELSELLLVKNYL